jgi:hypothetical protein
LNETLLDQMLRAVFSSVPRVWVAWHQDHEGRHTIDFCLPEKYIPDIKKRMEFFRPPEVAFEFYRLPWWSCRLDTHQVYYSKAVKTKLNPVPWWKRLWMSITGGRLRMNIREMKGIYNAEPSKDVALDKIHNVILQSLEDYMDEMNIHSERMFLTLLKDRDLRYQEFTLSVEPALPSTGFRQHINRMSPRTHDMAWGNVYWEEHEIHRRLT